MLDFLFSNHYIIFEVSWILILLSYIIAITISFDKRSPAKTISWLLVLTFLPGIGLIFYLLFGENLRTKKWRSRQQTIHDYLQSEEVKAIFDPADVDVLRAEASQRKIFFDTDEDLDISDKNIMHMMLRSCYAPITANNHVQIFTEGTAKFRQMMQDIEQATDHIHLEYFIIKDCPLSRELRSLLIRKAQEGVEVRIFFDDIGSWRLYLNPFFMRGMRQAGIQAKTFVQARFPYIHRKLNYRNHRKICVIDGRIGYIGGLNIGPEYVHQNSRLGFWRDTHLRIEGPAVYFLQTVFTTDWLLLTKEKLIAERYFPDFCNIKGSSIIQIAASGADSPHQSIYEAYFYAIAQAKETVYIQTPYFIPDEALLTALKTVALSGVKIKIIFPSVRDHYIVYQASLSYLEEVMEMGVEVYFYDKQPGPSFIHSKVLLVDHEIASVGTANIDIRSFNINSEITAFIYDKQTVNELYTMFEQDLLDCRQLNYEEFKNRGFIQKGKEAFCRLASPLL